MKITPQDIIDKEFKVTFRGFDKTEVDIFLEEVAEVFSKLTEEILALQEKMASGGGLAPQGQIELPAEIGNFLEELKQDNAAITAELASLKQDRSTFVSLEKNIKEAVASLQKAASTPQPQQGQSEIPADLKSTLEELKGVLSSAKEAGPAVAPQDQAERGDITKDLGKFRKGIEKMGGELFALKKEVGSMQKIRDEIKEELQGLLKSHFDALDAKLSKAAPPAAVSAAPPPKAAPAAKKKEEPLVAAIIEEEPEGLTEEVSLPDFEEPASDHYDVDLDSLSEADILDVDKLRDVFLSALDDSVTDTPGTREDDDDSDGDLLFLEDLTIEDEHEPEVTFSLDEGNAAPEPNESGTT